MNELENIVKQVVYGGIGAAATIVEKGGEIARNLVDKGQETYRANQGAVEEFGEDIKRRVKDFCEQFQQEDVIDISGLNREQRAELRRRLDEMDAMEDAAAEAMKENEAEESAPATDDDVPVYEAEEATYTAEEE